jgi:hypothetical protein
MAVYEMLWDCAYCGTRKLLGKTHRFCPGCGAPQDPTRRYFPSDEDKVLVENHEYVGADRLCGACGSAMGARAAHCTQCGSPMEGTPEVQRVADGPPGSAGAAAVEAESRAETPDAVSAPAHALAAAPSDSAGRGRGCAKWALAGCGLLGLGLVTLFVLAIVWRRPVEARVTGHTWERSVDVEVFGPHQDSAWCDQMPAGAYGVSRSREVRSHNRVPNGEDCSTRRVDQGDGTFREERECKPRYREEPVWDERCRFTVDRWTHARTAGASGSSLSPSPAWPSLTLRRGSCRGCEREGARREAYKVQLISNEGKSLECSFDEARWRDMADGSRWRVEVRVLTGTAACGTLAPAGR